MNLDWTPQPDWRPRLLRICERLRQRQPAIRAFLVTGDYAYGVQAPDSVLTCIAFFPDWRPDYTLGAVQALDGLPVALDWPTTAFLVEVEPACRTTSAPTASRPPSPCSRTTRRSMASCATSATATSRPRNGPPACAASAIEPPR